MSSKVWNSLINVSKTEYDILTMKSLISDFNMKNQESDIPYDIKVYQFYVALYDYANEYDVNWYNINTDAVILANMYAKYFPNNSEITPSILYNFYNNLHIIGHSAIKPFNIRVLFTKIAIDHKLC
jgi:hypothetical protein